MAVIFGCSLLAVAQRRDAYVESRDHPAIRYSTGATSDAVSALNARLENGSASLKYDENSTISRFFLAEVLIDEDRKPEARAELQRVIDAPISQEWAPEDQEYTAKAAALLPRVK